MPSDNRDGTRGAGFVHLNTPASIQYTAGQTLSLTALRQHKTRVECVVLPESMSVWRKALQRYVREEGYGSFAADIEDERSGTGVVLPPLVPHKCGPLRRRTGESISARDGFFCVPRPKAASATEAARNNKGDPLKGGEEKNTPDTSPAPTASGATAATTTTTKDGITIVSHHKIAGRQQFVYPDHDGVLSAGVVPQIVVTAEEEAEEAADKVYYVSPLSMDEEELAALEELQALWRSRARSHSFLGAQHRHAARGTVDPASTTPEDASRPFKARRVEGGTTGATVDELSYAEAETAVDDASTADKELAEALRLADDLLRFA